MRPEDLGSELDRAFDQIKPVDEDHKKRIEAMRRKIEESNRRLAAELSKAQQEITAALDDGASQRERERRKESSRAREEIARQTTIILTEGFDEQADQIFRIAERVTRS